MPNVMAALPNIGGALCNAAKARNPLNLAGVPQTHQQISAVSGRNFTVLLGHAEEILLFNKFFFYSRHVPSLEI